MIQSNNKQIHPTVMSKLSTKKNMIGLLILALIAIIAVTLGVGLKSLSEESKVSTFNVGDSNISVSNELEVISEWEWEHEKSLPEESKVTISGDSNTTVSDELEVVSEWEWEHEMAEVPCVGGSNNNIIEPIRALRAKKSSNDRSSSSIPHPHMEYTSKANKSNPNDYASSNPSDYLDRYES